MSFELNRLANQLDWNLLRTFMVIVQERSITGASQQLSVTQPSVSAALRRLEERLGVQLIERGSGRTFQITSAGEKVYREALEIYGGVVRLNALDITDDHILSGNIVIYRSSHLHMGFLTSLLAEFRQLHPAVTFSLTSAQCADVTRALQLKIASLAFCTRPEASPQFRRFQLPSQEFGCFCGPSHPLYRVMDPDPDILAVTDIVGYEGESLTGALAEIVRYRARNDIDNAMVATSSSIVDFITLLKDIPAVGCMAVQHASENANGLWRIPLLDKNLQIESYIVIDTERHITPAERGFLNFLSDHELFESRF